VEIQAAETMELAEKILKKAVERNVETNSTKPQMEFQRGRSSVFAATYHKILDARDAADRTMYQEGAKKYHWSGLSDTLPKFQRVKRFQELAENKYTKRVARKHDFYDAINNARK